MGKEIDEAVRRHRGHAIPPGRCGSVHVQRVSVPLPAVWSLVRRFDRPQAYKRFVRNCHVISGDGGVGTLREVLLVSGLPASTSTERLDELDDERHVAGFSVVGGDHRLANYRSTTSVHVAGEGEAAVVVESYVVDVPPGSTKEETVAFVDTIVRCNLRSLAHEAQVMARSVASDV